MIDLNDQNIINELRNQFILLINKYVKSMNSIELNSIKDDLENMYKYTRFDIGYYPQVKMFFLSILNTKISVNLHEVDVKF